jgi:hypothetical protein
MSSAGYGRHKKLILLLRGYVMLLAAPKLLEAARLKERMRRCEPSPRRESTAPDHVVDVGNDMYSGALPAIRMSRHTHDRANKTGLVGPDPFEDPMGKPRKEHPDEESIFANNPFIEGFFEWMDSPEVEMHVLQ